jgi:hypothetical protein
MVCKQRLCSVVNRTNHRQRIGSWNCYDKYGTSSTFLCDLLKMGVIHTSHANPDQQKYFDRWYSESRIPGYIHNSLRNSWVTHYPYHYAITHVPEFEARSPHVSQPQNCQAPKPFRIPWALFLMKYYSQLNLVSTGVQLLLL